MTDTQGSHDMSHLHVPVTDAQGSHDQSLDPAHVTDTQGSHDQSLEHAPVTHAQASHDQSHIDGIDGTGPKSWRSRQVDPSWSPYAKQPHNDLNLLEPQLEGVDDFSMGFI